MSSIAKRNGANATTIAAASAVASVAELSLAEVDSADTVAGEAIVVAAGAVEAAAALAAALVVEVPAAGAVAVVALVVEAPAAGSRSSGLAALLSTHLFAEQKRARPLYVAALGSGCMRPNGPQIWLL